MVDEPENNPYAAGPLGSFTPVGQLDRAAAEVEVEVLRDAIEYHDYRYYVENDPVISDAAYDRLFNRLEAVEDAFGLTDANSPTQRVGGEPIDELDTVEHVRPLLSLDSSAELEEVHEFDNRVRSAVGEVTYSAEPKFDGVSVEIVYVNGEFDRAVTRGDGVRGDDISHNVRTIRSVPLVIQGSLELLAVRGEIFMPKTGFHALNEERIQRGEEPFANPRNAAGGTVRQLDPSVVADRPLEIYFYDVIETSVGLESQRDAFKLLRESGLRVSERDQFIDDIQEFIAYRERLLETRDAMEAEIDGVVAKVDSFEAREIIGSTARHPRWAFAYKFPAKRGESIVRRIIVQVGRTGKLTPVALLDPVEVTGVMISRATLHNEAIATNLGVVEGAKVQVKRAGDVIPGIAEVIESPNGSFEMPSVCPVCESSVVKEGENHYCSAGMACPAQLRRSIQHFCSRQAMDIEGVGETLANQLVDQELVESIADLYSLSHEDLKKLDSFGDVSAENLIQELRSSTEPSLDRFIYALGIRHVGSERARVLAEAFTLEDLMDASQEELQAVEDIGPEVARSIRSFFEAPANRRIVHQLLEAGVSPVRRETRDEFEGVTIVLTGSIDEYTRTEVTDLLERHGANLTSSVSGETDLLVVGENPGSTKLRAADEYGTETITADEFVAQYLDRIQDAPP